MGFIVRDAVVAVIGAVLLAWVFWHSRGQTTNFLVRCLLINLAVLLLSAAMLYVFPGGGDIGRGPSTMRHYDAVGAMLGAVLLIVANLGIAGYLGWRLWTIQSVAVLP